MQREGEHGVDGAVVAVLNRKILEVLVGFLPRRAAYHRARGEDLDFLPEVVCDAPHLQDTVACEREMVRLVKHQVAQARAERTACHRVPGIHQDGPPPTPGPWLAHDTLQPVVMTIVIKWCLLRPEAEEDFKPFLTAGVAVVMGVLLQPEHLELHLIPATDNIEAEAALTDVIRRDDLFRCQHRGKHRHMHGAEHGEALGGSQ
jgi:hypothetical protein